MVINRLVCRELGGRVGKLDAEFASEELHDAQNVHVDGFVHGVGTCAEELTAIGTRVIILTVLNSRPPAFRQGVEIAEEAVVVRFLQIEIRAISQMNFKKEGIHCKVSHKSFLSNSIRLIY